MRWRVARLPVVERLRPGLSDAQMDSLTAPLGLRLPAEARTWWGWHDGAVLTDDPSSADARRISVSLEYLPLADAVKDYVFGRGLAARSAEEMADFRPEMADPDHFWTRSLFLITKDAGWVLCDCAVPEGAPTPIRWMEPAEMAEGTPDPKARSFGEMVTWWIEAWDRGLWSYSAGDRKWTNHLERRTEADNRRRVV